MTTFQSTRFSSVFCGLFLVALFVFALSDEVQAQQKRVPNKPAPRAPHYNPLAFDYQAAMQQVNNLPSAIYAPRYYPPYPYPYPYPYPHPYPYPKPYPMPYPMPGPGMGVSR